MFAGINDIKHGWNINTVIWIAINTVIFPKACKEQEHYSLLFTFLVKKMLLGDNGEI